jgi:hypothetical protein
MSARLARSLLAAAVMLAAACSGAPPVPARPSTGACDPAALGACEKRIAAARGVEGGSRDLLDDYAAARAVRDAGDPWAALHRVLGEAKTEAVILAEGGAAVDPAAGKVAQVIAVAALPEPAAITVDELILAMAEARGVRLVLRVRAGQVEVMFPSDPLAPAMAGLAPVVRDDAALARIEGDVELERAIHAAFDMAGVFLYVEAVKKTPALAKLVAARRDTGAVTLRARYALQLLAGAGLVLDAAPGEEPEKPQGAQGAQGIGDSSRPCAPCAPCGSLSDCPESPYQAYLAVLTAKDARKAWEARANRVLAGVAADRRADLAALFVRPKDCEALRAPPMEEARDLVFAGRLAGALAVPGAPQRAGQLPFAEWMARYETMTRLVEQTRTAWMYLPAMLQERGDASGLGLAGSATYRRVTEAGLHHIRAMHTLQEAEPARFRAFTQLGIATAPGLSGDPELQKAMVTLTKDSIGDKLAAESDPDAIVSAAATGVLAGLSYPPALQEAHLRSLHAAVGVKLGGELRDAYGWGVAALYAADAAYRLLAGAGGNLDASAKQIARALSGPNVPQPALAALASAAARYAALAVGKKLDPAVTKIDRFPPERRAAREALRAAIAGLGAPGEAPGNVLDDVTDLADGLVTTLSASLAAGKKPPAAKGKSAPPAACGSTQAVALDPTTRRALARLGDVRGRILAHPRYKQGDGAWVRRARLLVTVLSDAMDLALASDTRKAPAFAVAAADAEKAWQGALREVEVRGLGDTLGGGYALGRSFAASSTMDAFVKQSGRDLRRFAGGLLALFQGDALGGKGPALGVALLEAVAGGKGIGGADPGQGFADALAAYAGVLYGLGKDDQADLCLLGSLVIASVTHTRPPPAAVALAEQHGSRVAWALRYTDEIRKSGPGETPDPAAYAESMRRATDDACAAPDADATVAVVQAIHDFAGGKRREARDRLDRVLARADERGLGVPRMAYRFEEKTATKVFQANIDVSYGSGILLAGNTFQLGLGLRSGGEPGGSLTASLAPAESQQAAEDAARYYVYTAALATVYHLLDGDTERAAASGRRAVAALSSGLLLGPRRIQTPRPAAWGEDSREILVLAAQLAADAGMPFLAGDLWTVVRQGFPETLDDKAVATMLDHPLLGIATLPELAAVKERARRSLKVLAEPLPCTDAKVELGAYEEVTCEAYPTALSLRIADALKKLPRLRRPVEASARCTAFRELDAFLAGAELGRYDPDAFLRAVARLPTDDRAVLLARQRHPDHCGVGVVSEARSLGRAPSLGPALRADLLSVAVNCEAALGGPDMDADVLALDEETRRLPDPARNLKLVLWLADKAARTNRWDTLGKLVERPDFVGRWMSVHPQAAVAALLVDHATAAARGQPVAVEKTRGTYQLHCESFPSAERQELCAAIAALRAPPQGPAEERQRMAREAVKKLVTAPVSGKK